MTMTSAPSQVLSCWVPLLMHKICSLSRLTNIILRRRKHTLSQSSLYSKLSFISAKAAGSFCKLLRTSLEQNQILRSLNPRSGNTDAGSQHSNTNRRQHDYEISYDGPSMGVPIQKKNSPLLVKSRDRSSELPEAFDKVTQDGRQKSSLRRQDEVRSCMRLVPQAVVVVTASDMNDRRNPWRGATVSSFFTVTLEPDVIVSLNLQIPSSTFDAIQTSNRFDINVMKGSQQGARMAASFAKGHSASPFAHAGTSLSIVNQKRRDTANFILPPVLYADEQRHNPVAFRLSCTYKPCKTTQFGDHVVIFGSVLEFPHLNCRADQLNSCLTYIKGSYGRVYPLGGEADPEFDTG